MGMPERTCTSETPYRYGASNGQEKSTEINKNSYTADYWQYDARVVRRWNVDPLPKSYESPYSSFANNPIWFIDPNGADTTIKGENYQYKNGTSLENVTLTASTKGNKKWINARFKAAFAALVVRKETIVGIEKLLEGTGVRLANKSLSAFRFLGPAAAIASLPFTLSSDNISQPDLIRQTDERLNEYLQEGDFAGAQAYAETYNKERGRQGYSKIVFRYMSLGEFNNRLTPDGDLPQALPFDRNNNLAVKWITPGFYVSSKAAKTYLALPTAPDIAVWTYEVEISASKMPSIGYQTVKPKYGEPGGGKEATILQPFPIHGFFPLIK